MKRKLIIDIFKLETLENSLIGLKRQLEKLALRYPGDCVLTVILESCIERCKGTHRNLFTLGILPSTAVLNTTERNIEEISQLLFAFCRLYEESSVPSDFVEMNALRLAFDAVKRDFSEKVTAMEEEIRVAA